MAEPDEKTKSSSESSSTKPPLPDPALKWGVTPKHSKSSNSKADDKSQDQGDASAPAVDWENYYDEATKAKLRAKGVNPALKAEMEHGQRQHGREGSFWAKVAATSFGGGWIK